MTDAAEAHRRIQSGRSTGKLVLPYRRCKGEGDACEGIEGMRTLTYYVRSSRDGFIAAPDGSIDSGPGAGVWLAGGARLAGALLGEIDELVIKRYPVVLGAGIPFSTTDQACNVSFEIVDDRILRGGTTVARYTRTA